MVLEPHQRMYLNGGKQMRKIARMERNPKTNEIPWQDIGRML
jgi:hypothetical protein